MKKTLPFAAMAAALVLGNLCADAQITVKSNGQSQFGTIGKYNVVVGGMLIAQPVEVDTTSNIVVLGSGSRNLGGRITFGDESHVWIGETRYNDFLTLTGDLGIEYRMGDAMCFAAKKKTIGTATLPVFTFYTSVEATSFTTTSDLRLKKDITPLGESFRQLGDVNSISYRLTAKPISEDEESLETLLPSVPDERVHFGFVAQEIQEIFPELVNTDDDGYLSIDYQGFIPLLVDAYKNLAARNEELEEKVESLLHPVKKTAGTDGISLESVTLGQNRPNPFTESTVIDITLPSDVSTAILCIYDMQGTQVLQLPVEGRGKTAVTVKGTSLRPGMYLYSLIADGEEVATKRMILTE